jgi:alkyl sulfatase BDS1-like metallo-beta-lactamase superfamily hydrolase
MVLDYLAIRLNGPRAGRVQLRVNLQITGTDPHAAAERYLLTVENGVLRHTPHDADNAASTLRITRAALSELASGAATVDALLTREDAAVEGHRADLDQLFDLLDTFTGAFDLVTPNLR